MNRVGVVVGRFQLPVLHEGHIHLLRHVAANCDEMIIVLGCTSVRGDRRNPFSYKQREELIGQSLLENEIFTPYSIVRIEDVGDDALWSKNLDKIIEALADPSESYIDLYGSRDSFLPYYSGKYPRNRVSSSINCSATDARKECLNTPFNREQAIGIIKAYDALYEKVYPCVDIAVFSCGFILLGRKSGNDFWQLPGGFVSQNDGTLEKAAARELFEEASIEVDPKNLRYLTSFTPKDYRYKNESTGLIVSSVFTVEVENAVVPKASDDLEECDFFPVSNLPKLGPNHEAVIRAAVEAYKYA